MFRHGALHRSAVCILQKSRTHIAAVGLGRESGVDLGAEPMLVHDNTHRTDTVDEVQRVHGIRDHQVGEPARAEGDR